MRVGWVSWWSHTRSGGISSWHVAVHISVWHPWLVVFRPQELCIQGKLIVMVHLRSLFSYHSCLAVGKHAHPFIKTRCIKHANICGIFALLFYFTWFFTFVVAQKLHVQVLLHHMLSNYRCCQEFLSVRSKKYCTFLSWFKHETSWEYVLLWLWLWASWHLDLLLPAKLF